MSDEIAMPPACISQVAFVARYGTQCPHCGSEEIEHDPDGTDVEGTHIYTKSMCTKCDYEWNDKFQLTGYCDTFMSCKGDDLLEFLRKAAINQHTQKEEVRSMLAIWLGIAENMIEETEKHGCAADVAFWQSLFDKTVEVLGGTLVDPNLLPEDES
tara:strand:+ start:6566 stop:7033 length:468 start_codon:yes stop_codon:yes gene_type:complete